MHSVHVDVLSDGACCNFPCFQSKWVGIVGKCGKAEQFYNASALGAGFQFLNNEDLPLFQLSATEILASSLKGDIRN